jgi:hypothetical protein
MQWARARRLDDDPLLQACLQDLRFDVQVEMPRGEWLWRIIEAADAAGRFRVPILHALYDLADERSASQLCELARYYAEAGDDAFRSRLYDIVGQKPFAESPWLGEEEIIQLDGEEAFLFAARLRGRQLAGREWEWDDDSLVHDAVERIGEERVKELLGRTEDAAIQSFGDEWRRQEEATAGRGEGVSHRDRMQAITVDKILSAAQTDDRRLGLFRSWGRYAHEVDLEVIFQHLLAAREPTALGKLLAVFTGREVPRFHPFLIELCLHVDKVVRRRAFQALANLEHPAVREFALAGLAKGLREGLVASLFTRNYLRGDEHRILEALELPDDANELHWLLMDIAKVLEANPDADGFPLGIISYEMTPCENCRFHAVELMLDRQAAPGWLIEECRYDSHERCRARMEVCNGTTEG